MAEPLHVVCPHCDSTNRVPVEKLAASGRFVPNDVGLGAAEGQP